MLNTFDDLQSHMPINNVVIFYYAVGQFFFTNASYEIMMKTNILRNGVKTA